MTWRRRFRWIVIGSGTAFVALLAAAWIVGGALLASANRPVGPPPADLPIVITNLESDSGSKIATWYLPHEQSRATVILLHGVRANRTSMLGRARLFYGAGYSVVLIDLQAHGESAGRNITIGHLERHDVRAAVDYVHQTNPNHRIGIVGCSLGGAAALLASPLAIDALVLEAAYPTINEAVHDRVSSQVGSLSHVLTPLLLCQLQPRLGITTADLRPIDHIADAKCAVLVAAGDQDHHTKLDETQRLFETAREPKQLVIFPGAAHVDLLSADAERYQREILPIFNKHLNADGHDR